jgi:hypothetical protein
MISCLTQRLGRSAFPFPFPFSQELASLELLGLKILDLKMRASRNGDEEF